MFRKTGPVCLRQLLSHDRFENRFVPSLNLTASAESRRTDSWRRSPPIGRNRTELFVIQPEEVDAFLALSLPIETIAGRRKSHGRKTRSWKSKQSLIFGMGAGDPRTSVSAAMVSVLMNWRRESMKKNEVVPDRPTQSISAEIIFEQDVQLFEIEPMIRKLAEKTWEASRKETRIARTVVLKLKTSDFKILTRSRTPGSPPASCEELTTIALSLRQRVELASEQRFRLVGVGLSNFFKPEDEAAQSALFE